MVYNNLIILDENWDNNDHIDYAIYLVFFKFSQNILTKYIFSIFKPPPALLKSLSKAARGGVHAESS